VRSGPICGQPTSYQPRGLGPFLPPQTADRWLADAGRYTSWTRDGACRSHGVSSDHRKHPGPLTPRTGIHRGVERHDTLTALPDRYTEDDVTPSLAWQPSYPKAKSSGWSRPPRATRTQRWSSWPFATASGRPTWRTIDIRFSVTLVTPMQRISQLTGRCGQCLRRNHLRRVGRQAGHGADQVHQVRPVGQVPRRCTDRETRA